MVKQQLIEEILALTPGDREYVAALIASLGEDHPPQLNPAEQQEILRRAEDAEKNRDKMLSWEQVKQNLAAQRAGAIRVSLRIYIRPEVNAQILSHSSYLDGVGENLGAAMEAEVETMLQFISQFPLMYSKDFGLIRRGTTKRFKLAVYYIVRPELVDILDIRDARMEPPDWGALGFTDN